MLNVVLAFVVKECGRVNGCGELRACAVFDFGPSVGSMLRFHGVGMLALVQQVLDTLWHRQIDAAFFMVPFECDSTTEFAFLVHSDFAPVSQRVLEVFNVLFVNVLDSKVVDDQAKGERSDLVAPQAGGETAWTAATRLEVFDRLVKCKATCLG